MNAQTFNRRLFKFLESSPGPFHAVESLSAMFARAGAIKIDERNNWKITEGIPHFTVREDGTLILFSIGKNAYDGFRIVGSHSDSPCLQIKPKPDIFHKSYHKIGVEVYGGALLNPWFDRELSIAGRVTSSTKDGKIFRRLIDFKSSMAVIPSLAIHMDRTANSEKSINPQNDIIPIIGLDNRKKRLFTQRLKDHLNTILGKKIAHDILGFDLFFYDFHKPCYVGIDKEFVLSSRLDNLLSCFIAASAIIKADKRNNFMFICNNHEEVGSNTSSGAQSNLILSVFERLFSDRAQLYRILANSLFISVDNAHATHPNFADKHEPRHEIMLNGGPVLKINASQKYASNSVSNAIFKSLCSETEVPLQEFVMRNDMACGSTIGPITASKLGIQTVDVGAPSLSMHSIRELTGSRDPLMLYKVMTHFVQRSSLPHVEKS